MSCEAEIGGSVGKEGKLDFENVRFCLVRLIHINRAQCFNVLLIGGGFGAGRACMVMLQFC